MIYKYKDDEIIACNENPLNFVSSVQKILQSLWRTGPSDCFWRRNWWIFCVCGLLVPHSLSNKPWAWANEADGTCVFSMDCLLLHSQAAVVQWMRRFKGKKGGHLANKNELPLNVLFWISSVQVSQGGILCLWLAMQLD